MGPPGFEPGTFSILKAIKPTSTRHHSFKLCVQLNPRHKSLDYEPRCLVNKTKSLYSFINFFYIMHHHNNFGLHLLPRKELTQVYASAALRSFAISLVSLFIPIYLYIERGYTLQETLIFFLIYSVMFALFTPVAAKFSARYGIKHSVLISVPLYLGFIILLYLLPHFKIPLFVMGILLGMSLAFYWMGMNLVFRKASNQCSRGAEVGKKMSVSILATMIGPLLGGLIIQNFGFKVLFIISGLGLLS